MPRLALALPFLPAPPHRCPACAGLASILIASRDISRLRSSRLGVIAKDFNKIEKALNVHRTSKCVQWPKDLTNPDLSDSFVGLEKFLSTEFFEEFDKDFNIRLTTPLKSATESWQYDVNRKKLTEYKSDIHDELARRNSSADIRPLIDALSWLSGQLAALPPMVLGAAAKLAVFTSRSVLRFHLLAVLLAPRLGTRGVG